MLANEGLRRAAGKGVFVPGSHIERDLEVLKGFTQTMPDRNVMPSIKVLKKMIRPAGAKYAMMFGIHPEDEIFCIKRMRYGNMYPEAPGNHEWPYRDKAIRYAFQFFRNMDIKTTPIYQQVASFDRKGSNIV